MSRDAFGSPTSALDGKFLEPTKEESSSQSNQAIEGELIQKGRSRSRDVDDSVVYKPRDVLKEEYLHTHEKVDHIEPNSNSTWHDQFEQPPKMPDSPNNKSVGHASHKAYKFGDPNYEREENIKRVGSEWHAQKRREQQSKNARDQQAGGEWPSDTLEQRRSNPGFIACQKHTKALIAKYGIHRSGR